MERVVPGVLTTLVAVIGGVVVRLGAAEVSDLGLAGRIVAKRDRMVDRVALGG